jgi:soluble lytic murein transglycosylase-like protein
VVASVRWLGRILGIKHISLHGIEFTFAGAVGWGVALTVPVFGLALLCVWLAHGSSHLQAQSELLRAQSRQAQHRALEIQRVLDLEVAVRRIGGTRMPEEEAAEIAAVIDGNARLYGFDPFLILAVVSTESHGRARALGRLSDGELSGAAGMMQVMPATAKLVAPKLGVKVRGTKDLLDPGLNLAVGSAILLKMVHRYGDLKLGIMAYNVGPNALEAALHGEGTLPASYYAKVMAAYRQIRGNAWKHPS